MNPRTDRAWDALQRASAALREAEAQAAASIALASHALRIAQSECIAAATEEDRGMKT